MNIRKAKRLGIYEKENGDTRKRVKKNTGKNKKKSNPPIISVSSDFLDFYSNDKGVSYVYGSSTKQVDKIYYAITHLKEQIELDDKLKETNQNLSKQISSLDLMCDTNEYIEPLNEEKNKINLKGGDLVAIFLPNENAYIIGNYSPGKFYRNKGTKHFVLKDPLYIKKDITPNKIRQWQGIEFKTGDSIKVLDTNLYLKEGNHYEIVASNGEVINFFSAQYQKYSQVAELLKELYGLPSILKKPVKKPDELSNQIKFYEKGNLRLARINALGRSLHPSNHIK